MVDDSESSEEQRRAVCDCVAGHVCGGIGWCHWLTLILFHYDGGLQSLTTIFNRWTPARGGLLAMTFALTVLQITGGSSIVHTCNHIPGVGFCF